MGFKLKFLYHQPCEPARNSASFLFVSSIVDNQQMAREKCSTKRQALPGFASPASQLLKYREKVLGSPRVASGIFLMQLS